MKFYFAGSIRSGRDNIDIYIKINEILERFGEVLDKHVASPNVFELEQNKSFEEIYIRDTNWIKECDMLVAEVSTPSLGVGYEISYAQSLGKKIICIYNENINVSAMIRGNNYIDFISYKNTSDLINKLESKF